MKHAALACSILVTSLLVIIGCGRPDSHQSIELTGEGVESFNAGALTAAEKKFEKATSLWPENHTAFYNLGQTLEARKKYEDAADAFEEAVKLRGKDAMYHYRLGKVLLDAEKSDKAEAELEKAIELNPKIYKAHYYLGEAYARKDKIKEAAESWTHSAKANPLWGKPFNSLGKLYIMWDKLPEAVKVLENGAVNVRGDTDLSMVYYHLGFAYEQQSNFDKAIENYTKSLDVKNNPDALRQRGVSYAAKEDWGKAKKDLDAFLKVGGSDQFNTRAVNELLMKIASRSRK